MPLSRNGRAARAYAELGFAVFPMRGKVPFKGSNGELDGTTEAATIDRWWTDVPDASIAVALRFTPWFVLDVDRRTFGDATLRALESEHGSLPHTATVLSGSSNWSSHHYFVRPAELEGVSCRALRYPGINTSGIDVKGARYGYVVCPHRGTRKQGANTPGRRTAGSERFRSRRRRRGSSHWFGGVAGGHGTRRRTPIRLRPRASIYRDRIRYCPPKRSGSPGMGGAGPGTRRAK